MLGANSADDLEYIQPCNMAEAQSSGILYWGLVRAVALALAHRKVTKDAQHWDD